MVVCYNGHAALSWPRLSRTFHKGPSSPPPTALRPRRPFPPTVHSLPVRHTPPNPLAQDAAEPSGKSDPPTSSEDTAEGESVLYDEHTLSATKGKEEKSEVETALLNKPVANLVREETPPNGEVGSSAQEPENRSKVMEDLGNLFSEVGFGEGRKGLSSVIEERVRELNDGRRGAMDRSGPRMARKDSPNTAARRMAPERKDPQAEKAKEQTTRPISTPSPRPRTPPLTGPPPSRGPTQKPQKQSARPKVQSPVSQNARGGPKPTAPAPAASKGPHTPRPSAPPSSAIRRPAASSPTTPWPAGRTAPRPSQNAKLGLARDKSPVSNTSSQDSVVAPKPAYVQSKPSSRHVDDAVTSYFKTRHKNQSEAPVPDENAIVGDDLDIANAKGKAVRAKSARNLTNTKNQPKNEHAYTGNGNKRQRKSFEGQFGGTSALNRRKARQQRQERRDSRVVVEEKEEIIEVGEEGLLVNDLAANLAVEPAEILKTLFMKGIMATVTQTLDMDTVKVVGLEFGVEVWDKNSAQVSEMAKKTVDFLEDEESSQLMIRPPVVTVMGHVDHGKVADGEAGGITQAIGAYTCQVTVDGEQKNICFLDTPGHEAFSAMRARGARVTDMAIIIVAADDGIQPQTREAVSHAKAADVPVLVAINKIDKEGANVEHTKQQLSELELLPEDWGGKTPVVPISARTGEGIDDLLEVVCLMAEMELELVANPSSAAVGTVVEADLDRRAGAVATLLVQNGTLRGGDAVVSGASYGKVRSLTNDKGDQEPEAGPSVAVRMLGLNSVPVAGDSFEVVADDSVAREKAQEAADRLRSSHLAEVSGGGSMVTLSSLASIDEDEEAIQRVNIVLKADTSGAIEAVKSALGKLPQDSVMLRFLHAATGDITESDVSLAETADGFVLGYNIQPTDAIASLAKKTGVDIRSYNVIYDLLDDIRAAMEGRIKAVINKTRIGSAEVKAVFGAGSRTVAGCAVTDGRLEKGCVIQVFRKKKTIYEGKITSLRRVKEIVSIVEAGLECGVGSDFENWQEGDRIEALALVERHLSLEEAHATAAVDLKQLEEEVSDF